MSAAITMKKQASRQKRKIHIRKTVSGSTERPRLSVYRSLNHIYAQVIDDVSGKTIVAASTLSPELKDGKGKKKDQAKEVGKPLANKFVLANCATEWMSSCLNSGARVDSKASAPDENAMASAGMPNAMGLRASTVMRSSEPGQ